MFFDKQYVAKVINLCIFTIPFTFKITRLINSMFNSEDIITEHISNADLRAYFVGYDFGMFRYDQLVNKIMETIVDFSFGYHEGILSTYTTKEIRKAASLVYKIEKYDPNNPKHKKKTKDGMIPYKDEEEYKRLRYYNRGEFGELILHLLLRDFVKTSPLLSKIYFKDSIGHTVHGFDCVHIGKSLIDEEEMSLYLGESKLHRTGESGVDELIKDISEHFNRDFLENEFMLIGNKNSAFLSPDQYKDENTYGEYCDYMKDKTYWYEQIRNVELGKCKLQEILKSVTIPMLCTYTSSAITNKSDENTDEFKKEYENEVQKLKLQFDAKLKQLQQGVGNGSPVSTNLNIVLMLFPIPDKKELVKRLHDKLFHYQNI